MVVDPREERRGRELALALLRDLGADWVNYDLTAIPDAWIGEAMIAREPSILRRYLQEAHAGGEHVELGFMRVVSDFIGGAIQNESADFLQNHYEGRRHD